MDINIPFLTSEDNCIEINDDLELACVFLYFEINRAESLRSMFTKHPKENIVWISRGLYPLTAKLYSTEDNAYYIHDNLGLVKSCIEIDSSAGILRNMDIAGMQAMDTEKRNSILKEVLDTMQVQDKTKFETGYIIHSYKNIESILKGEYKKSTIPGVNLRDNIKSPVDFANKLQDAIKEIEDSIEYMIQMHKNLCDLDDDSFKNSIIDKNRVYDELKDKVYQTDKQVSSNIAKLIIEREDKIREVDKLYSDRIAFLTQDLILNKNKYDIAQIYGNEIEMGIHKKGVEDSEAKIEQYKKGFSEEIAKLETHYDSLLEEEKNKIKLAIKERDEKIKECEDLYNNLHNSIDAIKKNISDRVYAGRSKIEEIKGGLGKFDRASGDDTININIPFYIAEYKDTESRYKLFIPSLLKEKNQFISIISGIAGKIHLPFSEREKFFDDIFKLFKEFLKSDDSFPFIYSMEKGSILNADGIHQKVESGLKSLLELNFINDKSYEKARSSIKAIFEDRAVMPKV